MDGYKWFGGLLSLAAAALLSGLSAASARAQQRDTIIFAAASLKNTLDAVNRQTRKETDKKAAISYAASSALAKQIEQGAPAQMFVSADVDWMDDLAWMILIRADTRSNLLGNRIVLIAAKDKAAKVDNKPGFDLAKLLGNGRWAMANVDVFPAGRFGKAALQSLGVWASASKRTAQSENVRAALLRVSRGKAPVGIVYRMDAASDPNVASIGIFPDATHTPIIYPVAPIANASHPHAAAFFAYLRSDRATPLFEAQGGFTVLRQGRS